MKMLNVKVEKKGSVTVANLEGQIDESFTLDQDLPNPQGELHLYCGGVNRMNSIGVKKWMLYLQAVAKKIPIVFFEVAPAMVEQFNMISNFGANGKVMSIQLPYSCHKCKATFRIVRTCENLQQAKGKLNKEKCPKCGAMDCEFDDVPEEYLHFLRIA